MKSKVIFQLRERKFSPSLSLNQLSTVKHRRQSFNGVRLSATFQGIFVRSVGDVAETPVAAASSLSRHIADRRQPRSVFFLFTLSCIVTIAVVI